MKNKQSFSTNKLITFSLLLVLIGIISLLGIFVFRKTDTQTLVSSINSAKNQTIQPTPTPTPQVFLFDKTTDLKSELDSINPEVLDSDFDNLKQITTSL